MEDYRKMIESLDKDGMRNSFERHLKEAVQDAVELQTKLGIDVITDGELARDSYVSYFCRLMDGFDLVKPGRKLTRNGAADVLTLRIISKLKPQSDTINSAIVKDFLRVRSMTSSPVKVNIPGPMTIKDTMLNFSCNDLDEMRADLITCINEMIKVLVQQGCMHVQVCIHFRTF